MTSPGQSELDLLREGFFRALPRFRYISTLGRGGTGIVFRAHDTQLEEDVALKLLLVPSDGDTTEALARLRREVVLSRKIKHPNVAKLHDIGSAGPFWYLVMEFISGRTLEWLVREMGPLPLTKAIPILRQVCRGLAAAHASGVVHRDLKPQNVIVDDRGAVAILDFGLARGRFDPTITREGVIMGTPAFMAPEQLRGEGATESTDLYAFGALAFFLLTGRIAFLKDTPLALAIAVLNEPVPLGFLEEAHVPAELASIVVRCLSKSPKDRPTSADQVETDLARVELHPRARVTPAGAHPEHDPEEVSTYELDREGLGRPTVLVSEDDSLQRREICKRLEANDCRTLEAADGREAVEIASSQKVDLVLLDVRMPVMDGFDALRVLRSMPGLERLPIILISAFEGRDRQAFAIQAGATDFLPKRLPAEEMVERVWRQLARDGFWRH